MFLILSTVRMRMPGCWAHLIFLWEMGSQPCSFDFVVEMGWDSNKEIFSLINQMIVVNNICFNIFINTGVHVWINTLVTVFSNKEVSGHYENELLTNMCFVFSASKHIRDKKQRKVTCGPGVMERSTAVKKIYAIQVTKYVTLKITAMTK